MILRVFNYILRKIRLFILRKNKRIILSVPVFIDNKSKILAMNGAIIINRNVVIRSSSKGYHAGMPFHCTLLTDKSNASIQIGENSRLNGVYIHAQKSISIGKNCVIAAGVNILDSNGHILHSKDRTIGRDNPKEILIGDNVWIGLNSIILKGTVIGNNSVISAGSVVKGYFPDNKLIGGNPAIILGEINYD